MFYTSSCLSSRIGGIWTQRKTKEKRQTGRQEKEEKTFERYARPKVGLRKVA
jgi:hypothetical protein